MLCITITYSKNAGMQRLSNFYFPRISRELLYMRIGLKMVRESGNLIPNSLAGFISYDQNGLFLAIIPYQDARDAY